MKFCIGDHSKKEINHHQDAQFKDFFDHDANGGSGNVITGEDGGLLRCTFDDYNQHARARNTMDAENVMDDAGTSNPSDSEILADDVGTSISIF